LLADDFSAFNVDEPIPAACHPRRTFANPSPGLVSALPKSTSFSIARSAIRFIQVDGRFAQTSGQILVVGDYVLDTLSYELHTPRRGRVRLTPVQYDLVYHLMSHPGQIYSPARLLDEVWDYPVDAGSPDLVRVHIKNLRARVEPDPQSPEFIRTVPGFGYTVGEQIRQAAS
jgi:DNA-binding response OmpR family regulator